MGSATGGLVIVAVLFGLLLAVLWIILPFAVFAIRSDVKQMAANQRKSLELLQGMAAGSRQATTRESADRAAVATPRVPTRDEPRPFRSALPPT